MTPEIADQYSRPISPDDWARITVPTGIVIDTQPCVEGDGDIDPAALAAAVEAASAACPGARLVRRGTRWVDSGQAPAVQVVAAADFDRNRLDSPLLRGRLTCYRSSCEVILVRGTPTTVVFRANPAVMDAQGALLWQRQAFRALRGEPLEGATSTLTRAEVMAQIAARHGVQPPATEPEPGPEWRSVLGSLPRGPRRSMWRRRTIDGIHPGVTAKVARLVTAYGDGTGDGQIGVTVDPRQYLPELRTTAGLGAMISVLVQPDDDWSDVNAKMLKALDEYQFLTEVGPDDQSVLAMPLPFLREFGRWVDNLVRKNEDAIKERMLATHLAAISYLGAVDLAEFSCAGFTATGCYSLGSVAYNPAFDIVECGGRTEVTLAWRDGPGVGVRAEALLDWIQEGLSPRAYRCWEGNQSGYPVPADTLTGLFAAQAARTPDAAAVSGPAGELSYAGLAAQAAGITAALTAAGIGRGDRVALVAGRAPATIAAIWGILGAGAAYLPVDAAYPDKRITALLTDAAAPACLLGPAAAGRGITPPGCRPITLDTIPPAPPGTPWPVPGITPADLACIIYTSGSTGTPKGVEIEHAALVNYTRWATREAALDATTRMPLIASISFDMAGCALYLPLLSGGAVLPVPDVNAVTLRQVIEDHGATALAITPSHLDLINQCGITRHTMRVIMTAGELLRRSTALRTRDIFGPGCAILCQWGPTETTIVNTSHRFDPATDTDPGIPFGRPMDNNTIYLLDSRGRHVPPGEPGEACVGGTQLARGYLARPDLTRQKFTRLADGTRIYRTGDIVRLLPAGDLAFISRADDQVKIAGHRIEPAEITQALENHPAITAAAVIPRTRPGRHDKELCAYIVTTTGTTPHDLKTHLTTHLPRYMHPATTTVIPAIPRTPNGKTDHRQLPDPFTTHHPPPPPTPHDDITTTITHIWAHTLNTDPTTLDEHADFHHLGGNSLLLLAMINEVSGTLPAPARDHFMTNLSHIIRQPTLGHICDLARQTTAQDPSSAEDVSATEDAVPEPASEASR